MTEKKDIFEVATSNPQDLLQERRGMYLMINAIAKQADWIETHKRSMLTDSNDVVSIATSGIVEGKVKIYPLIQPDADDISESEALDLD